MRIGRRRLLLSIAAVGSALGVLGAAESPLPSAGLPGREPPPTPVRAAKVYTLDDCIRLALSRNPDLEQARARVAQIDADAILERSRFLPTVDMVYSRDFYQPEEGDRLADTVGSVRWRQRIFEFGKDPESVRKLRADQREALYAYEELLRDVISQVRIAFFSLLLKEEQLAQRRQILAHFRKRYEEVEARFENGTWVDRTTLLLAELNVKNEERRIILLEREKLRIRIRLGRLMSIDSAEEIEIDGELLPTEVDLEEIVRIAQDRSTEAANAREEVWERQRELRQLGWEFAPDLSIEAGMAGGDARAGISLTNEEETWGLDLNAEGFLDSPKADFPLENRFPSTMPDDAEWFARVTVTLPFFEGLARRGRIMKARERLREARARLNAVLDTVEADVRRAYQDLMERRSMLRNSEEIALNSGETLRLKQEIKDLLPERVSDNELETFRERFFRDQDAYFADQDRLITAVEELRRLAGWFE